MKVTTGYNPYEYQQQQRAHGKNTGFADMLAANQAHATKNTAVASYTLETKKSEASAANEQIAAETIAEKMPFLSKEQAEYLSGKYDVNNLSKEDEKALLGELEEMGIISKDENHKVYARTAKVPPEWMHGGLRAVEGQSAAKLGDSLKLTDFSSVAYYPSLSKDMSLYDYLQGIISDENKLYDEGKEKYGEKGVAYMTDLMQTHQKLFDVLEEIKAVN